ncbi:hypothetical protein SARC_07633 [Sphaeroforma arctica JP610]|uniref:Uncharacterized protein n=1 Tax=Sphaeroforma arctica JP610 TaxID=667725 RepID=A0A0L0FT59_9EUKA|nr:hypothetical protein SARC_07633 [Sphaeroforma arctica JP610]KNC79990.1 hypothetical protein SARC_07633 [Sphaeroforma arctica JP610]|eukprot:XP_014153892.1 hypothetical protein SARC_07633 [Sphaeroforma arctica JP610]
MMCAQPEKTVSEQPKATQKANDKITDNKTANKVNSALSGGLETNLFGCLEDIIGCVLACCVPCVVDATTQAKVDERECSIFDVVCCPSGYSTRQSMRAKYGMEYNELTDCLSACVCRPCFVSQNAREIAVRQANGAKYICTPKEM